MINDVSMLLNLWWTYLPHDDGYGGGVTFDYTVDVVGLSME